MADNSVKRLAMIMAIVARADAMKARNALEAINGNHPVYIDDLFHCENELLELANKSDDELFKPIDLAPSKTE